jgi:hypothetical protein
VQTRQREESGCAQCELDSNRVERECDLIRLRPVQEPRIDQGMHIAVDSLHIAVDSSRDLADGERPMTGHGFEHGPTLGREDFDWLRNAPDYDLGEGVFREDMALFGERLRSGVSWRLSVVSSENSLY